MIGDIVSKLTATPSRRQSGSSWRFASDCSEMEADRLAYLRSEAYVDTNTVIEAENVFIPKRGHVLTMTSTLESTSTKHGLIRHCTRKQTAMKI